MCVRESVCSIHWKWLQSIDESLLNSQQFSNIIKTVEIMMNGGSLLLALKYYENHMGKQIVRQHCCWISNWKTRRMHVNNSRPYNIDGYNSFSFAVV